MVDMDLIARTVGNAAGLWIAAALLSGITLAPADSTGQLVINLLLIGLVLAILNSAIKPIAKVLTFPLYLLTFGLFSLVVNGIMLQLTSSITRAFSDASATSVPLGLEVSSFGYAVIAAIIISLISSLISGLLRSERE